MPKRMPRFDNDLLNGAQTAIAIVTAGELSHSSGTAPVKKAWKISRLEALYELAYLRIFATWEMCLESIFLRSLCGYESKAAGGPEQPVAGHYYRSIAAAETAVLGSKVYMLWHNPSHVITRCNTHIRTGPGCPCVQATVLASNLARLEYFSHTRHRIVHTHQSDAKAKFDAATMSLAGRTYLASRPGKFLRDHDYSKSPTRPWLDAIADEMVLLTGQMV
jgi:hypothetical protein